MRRRSTDLAMKKHRRAVLGLVVVLAAGCDATSPPPTSGKTPSAAADQVVAPTHGDDEAFFYGEVAIVGDSVDAPVDAVKSAVAPDDADAAAPLDLGQRLQRLGFDLREPDDDSLTGDDAASLLVRHRRGVWFDVETGMWPNEHDALARDFADALAPALDGASFSEVAPGLDDDATPYQVAATLGGRRYRVAAQNHGDWYDVDAIVGLLNTMLRDRGDPQRLLVLATEDQTAIVVAGPASALIAAVGEGLLAPASPEQAMTLGKAFEARAMRALQER